MDGWDSRVDGELMGMWMGWMRWDGWGAGKY